MTSTLARPRELPLVGSMFRLRPTAPEFQAEIMRECGDIGLVHMGPMSFVAVTTPELCRKVLLDDHEFAPSSKNEIVRPLIGDFLYFQDPENHLRHRRVLSSLFSAKRLPTLMDEVDRIADEEFATWPTNVTVNVADLWYRMLLRIGCRVFLGVDSREYSDKLLPALDLFLDHCALMFNGVTLPLGIPTPHNSRVKNALKTMQAVAQEMINELRTSDTNEATLLSVLLDAQATGATITDDDMRKSIGGLFMGSTHTSQSVLSWSIYYLTQHPYVYTRMKSAVDEAVTTSGEDHITVAAPYANQVIKETMRLRPPNAVLPREATHDTDVGGYPMKRGTQIYPLLRAMHHRAQEFPDPYTFDPDRPYTTDRSLDTTLPFGVGTHNCLGSHFAMLQNPLLLTRFCQTFDVEIAAGDELEERNEFFMQRPPRVGIVLQRR